MTADYTPAQMQITIGPLPHTPCRPHVQRRALQQRRVRRQTVECYSVFPSSERLGLATNLNQSIIADDVSGVVQHAELLGAVVHSDSKIKRPVGRKLIAQLKVEPAQRVLTGTLMSCWQ